VEAVVEGSVRRSGNRVLITVQLVHASTDKNLWGSSYERDLADVFALQSEVAQSIATRIGVTLASGERDRLASSRRVDPAAHVEYLKGRFYWSQFSEAGFRKSLDHFNRALEIDPTFALAHVGVSDAYAWLSTLYMPPAEAMPKAAAAAERALELDPELAEAYAARGYVRAFNQWRWREGEADIRRAIALRPGNANAHFYLGSLLVAFGRFDEAIAALGRAHELDPLSRLIETAQLYPLFEGRRFDQAVAHAERILLEDSLAAYATSILAQALMQQGEIERAIPVIQRRMRIMNQTGAGGLAYPHALQGKRDLALRELEHLKRSGDNYELAVVYGALGMKDEAFDRLGRELDLRRETMVYLAVDPQMDPLRSDPRFATLLARLGLGS
jgi:tetratricopeptide (TPR) repeat protein